MTISADAVDPDDVEMLEDLVVAAVNEALAASARSRRQSDGRRRPAGLDLGGLGGLLG